MEIKLKKLSKDAKIPLQGSTFAAGYDMYATSVSFIKNYLVEGRSYVDPFVVQYGTGIAIEIPKGYCGLLFPRSSVYKNNQSLCNSIGLIDSDYRGEIKFNYYNFDRKKSNLYNIGDRVGQLVIIKHEDLNFKEVDSLSDTARGKGGFGSTGK